MVCSEAIFKSIFNCVKDVATTVEQLEEHKLTIQEKKKSQGAYLRPEG